MKLRAPATPIITVNPYFNVWSATDKLIDSDVVHWTGKRNSIRGTVSIDGKRYRFMGLGDEPALLQTGLLVSAAETVYTFCGEGITLTIGFYTPQHIDDYMWMSRPVSFMKAEAVSLDQQQHSIIIELCVSEEICIEATHSKAVATEMVGAEKFPIIKMGAKEQKVLSKAGDEICIDWGYFYLSAAGDNAFCQSDIMEDMTAVKAIVNISQAIGLFVFAYDDIQTFEYFGEKIQAYWKKDGETITEAISNAFEHYEALLEKSNQFSENLYEQSTEIGGEAYAELLQLAYRQVMGAHELALDQSGKLIYVSKECRSGGFGCTVDVTYPAIPMYLLYNPSLIEGMITPVFRYAMSAEWQYDFAPHDVGVYPHINGQRYGMDAEDKLAYQMPVEECGNMIIISYAMVKETGNIEYIKPHMMLLKKWASYLMENGVDPNNQLCTDDFAGHLAHNCNLSLKAIMALCCIDKICEMLGDNEQGRYLASAKEMAEEWKKAASNQDGSYRLAFDKPNTYSMKYNMVWDSIFRFDLFEHSLKQSEFNSYQKHMNQYGMPLDNRADYTKSDWILWTACFADTKEAFEQFIQPIWNSYHETETRVPMTDWFDTKTAKQVGFQNRTVQGGLFMKLYAEKQK